MAMDRGGVENLTPAQKACLRLVFLHYSSKDIGRELFISPHTVDNHIKSAVARIGAKNRFDAARHLADSEGAPERRTLASQSAIISAPMLSAEYPSHDDSLEREGFGDPRGGVKEVRIAYDPVGFVPQRLKLLPLPGFWGEQNDLTRNQRLIWITIIALLICLSIGAVVAALGALGSIL